MSGRGMARLENKLRRTVEQMDGWEDRAVCRDADPAIFFPDVGDNAVEAKALCARCPVQVECRTFALENPDLAQHGIWGGLSEKQRQYHPERRRMIPADTRDVKPCGTDAAYWRHVRAGEDACGACSEAHAAYVRDRRWGKPQVKPCGSESAYRRHVKVGEEPCEACVRAHWDFKMGWVGRSARDLIAGEGAA